MAAKKAPKRLDSPRKGSSSGPALKVVLLERREVTRRGIMQMLLELPLVDRIETVDSPKGAAAILDRGAADVLILTSELHESEVAFLLRRAPPTARVLLIVGDMAPDWVAYFPADALLQERELALRKLAKSLRRVFDKPLPSPETMEALAAAAPNRATEPWRPRLTPRESQALALLAEGMTNRQIASALKISENGAKRHVGSILAKLNCPNRTLAVARAIREGLLATPPPAGDEAGGGLPPL